MTQYRTSAAHGFTLIELVIVVLILGIIAVIVTPKFINFTDDSHQVSVENTAAALRASIVSHQALWNIDGSGAQVRDLVGSQGDALDMNAQGYPIGLNVTNGQLNNNRIGVQGENNIHGCRDIWNSLLTQAPTVSNNNDGADYEYYRHTGGRLCGFVYRKAGDTVNGRANVQLGILYDSRVGSISLCGQSVAGTPSC
ncbi:type II secretion system protein [Shewanella gelidii]|nr:type II secretion system protein [Shewanella gelidii]MCL1097020.1 type II secretion system GspH family protein [Shewanella gelidii]